MKKLKFSSVLIGLAMVLAASRRLPAQDFAIAPQPLPAVSMPAEPEPTLASPPAQTSGAAPGGVAGPERTPDGRMLIDEETLRRLIDDQIQEREKLKKEDEERKKKEAAAQGYEIGSDLSLKASLKDGFFPWLETPNKDFTMHLSCWTQWDNVWWSQSDGLIAPRGPNAGPAQGVASGTTLGGIGSLQDGVFFRRIRPNVEGTFWELGEYRFIPAFENSQFNTAGADEIWVGAKSVPVLGMVRAGHVKNAMGLEADMTASSRCMTFMERSAYSEAVEMHQNFVTGLWFSNNYLDQRTTWSFVVFRPDVFASTDAFFGDGQGGVQGRITGLPIYENDGRQLLHLGLSGGKRNGTTNLAVSSMRTVQLRARNELRDDTPGGGFINADNNRMLDTGVIASDAQYLTGLEAMYIQGPLSIQSEYGWTWVDNVLGFAPTGQTLHPALDSPQSYVFNGGYFQVAYTLTGENRGYDKVMGTMSRAYFGKAGPYNRAWIVKDEDGHISTNLGAWELAGRYSYIDLNNGVGEDRIQGGMLHGSTVALNWYLNNNLTVNFDWVHEYRYDLPNGSVPGHVDALGTRVQFQF